MPHCQVLPLPISAFWILSEGTSICMSNWLLQHLDLWMWISGSEGSFSWGSWKSSKTVGGVKSFWSLSYPEVGITVWGEMTQRNWQVAYQGSTFKSDVPQGTPPHTPLVPFARITSTSVRLDAEQIYKTWIEVHFMETHSTTLRNLFGSLVEKWLTVNFFPYPKL